MKTYLLRILYCGEDVGVNHIFNSNKKSVLAILKDFYEKENEEDISLDDVEDIYFGGEDIVELLVDMDGKKILVDNGEY